jgi:predicted neutral ceramidase superfamily lipid hydrolase
VTTGCALWIDGDGMPLIAFAVALAGIAAFAHWTLRHAYDQSLVLAHDMPAPEAMRVGPLLASLQERWTPSLLAAIAAPLLAAVLLGWLAAQALAPPVGGAIFVLALAFWLPLPALALTIDCDRLLVEATEPAGRAAI